MSIRIPITRPFSMAGSGIPALQLTHASSRAFASIENVWQKNPLYFLTICVSGRRRVLNTLGTSQVLIDAWKNSPRINGWAVGRYVIMPDHVHFFARDQTNTKTLSAFVRDWKRWTANQIITSTNLTPPFWQPEYFDHVLRSAESYSEKWEYVHNNPVRAGLASNPDSWPHSGECEILQF